MTDGSESVQAMYVIAFKVWKFLIRFLSTVITVYHIISSVLSRLVCCAIV